MDGIGVIKHYSWKQRRRLGTQGLGGDKVANESSFVYHQDFVRNQGLEEAEGQTIKIGGEGRG